MRSSPNGILTCDWHERSFDLEGGGCFNVECDDLQTFPAETRNGEIWIKIGDFAYKRKDEHLRLLWEGLLSKDRWTMSKAIALLLKGGVLEEEIVELILRHVGWHIASSHGSEGGHDVARLINGLKVGRRYEDAGLAQTIDMIEAIQVNEIGRQTRQYLNAGFSGERLLSEIGQCILKDDNGWDILHTLRTVFDEWNLCEGHPARNQLIVGLARWTTDVRKRTGSDSAAKTAQRFAQGQTAVDLYE